MQGVADCRTCRAWCRVGTSLDRHVKRCQTADVPNNTETAEAGKEMLAKHAVAYTTANTEWVDEMP